MPTPIGENLAKKFKARGDGVWELLLVRPITDLAQGKLAVAVNPSPSLDHWVRKLLRARSSSLRWGAGATRNCEGRTAIS